VQKRREKAGIRREDTSLGSGRAVERLHRQIKESPLKARLGRTRKEARRREQLKRVYSARPRRGRGGTTSRQRDRCRVLFHMRKPERRSSKKWCTLEENVSQGARASEGVQTSTEESPKNKPI